MHRRLRRWIILLMTAIALSTGTFFGSAQTRPTPVSNVPYQGRQFVQSDRLGITFISSAQLEPDNERYQNALLLGSGWTRWPLYWNAVETSPGEFDWSAYDRLVIDDMRYGLNINAILLDRPGFYADGAIIAGLNEPIFADGTDTPDRGKAINPGNPWAAFVYRAVQRYKPGGVLAQQQGWFQGEGITLWEIWNEPDLPQFWQGGIINYARLLKVAYLAAKQADPTAQVMYGGLLFNTPDNWLARVLAIYENDPLARSNNWYMDAVALHSYSYPWRTGWLTLFVRETLRAYGLSRPIFVNETGVSVWNDYPGPTWTESREQRLNLATAEQQAWFFIQSTAYAWVEGASVVFFHQLYDDCGDQPAGTNFPPHNGELCANGERCFGDAWGLFRNRPDSICYSQHPSPGSPRPAAAAFRMMAQVFNDTSFVAGDETRIDGVTVIDFERPNTQERILVVWNRRFEPNTASIPASADTATLYTLDRTRTITAVNGRYEIPLQAAVPDNFVNLEPNDISAIGGEPVILVESIAGDVPPIDATAIVQADQVSGTAEPPTPGPVIRPTVAPEEDSTPPRTFIEALPPVSARTFIVSWGANDNGTVERFVVWVRINGGEWIPWLETQRTDGIYTGLPGDTYEFAVWAIDAGGNWSTNVDLAPQASTQVE